MADLNRYECLGRVGSLKLSYMPNGNAVMDLSVAVDRSYKGRDGQKVERTLWVRVKAFEKQAEFIDHWIRKGKRVLVQGEMSERSWEDKDGNKRSQVEILVGAPGMGVTPIDWPDKDDQPPQERPQPARGNQNPGRGRQQYEPQPGEQDGPAFPSEASGMDQMPGDWLSDVPFALILAPLATLAMAAMQGGWLC